MGGVGNPKEGNGGGKKKGKHCACGVGLMGAQGGVPVKLAGWGGGKRGRQRGQKRGKG